MTSSSYVPQRADRVLNELRDDLEELYRGGKLDRQFVVLYLQLNARLLRRAVDTVVATPAVVLEELQQANRLNRAVVDGTNLTLVIGALDTAERTTPELLRDSRWLEFGPDEYAVENLMRYVSYAAYLMSADDEIYLHPVKRYLGRTEEVVEQYAPIMESDQMPPDSASASSVTESTGEATAESVASVSDLGEAPDEPEPHRQARARTAHYNADSYLAAQVVEGADPLDIREDVEMLASLIASRNIEPPLSIGIFGEWGSGKSYFMNQVRQRIKLLADVSKGRGSGYCTDIVNVDFNAWQYTGSSSAKNNQLWSSLVHRVFEGIRDHMDDDASYRSMLAEIQHQSDEVKRRQDAVVAAEHALDTTPRPAPDRSVAAVAGNDKELAEAAAVIGDVFRVPPAQVNMGQLIDDVRELRSTTGRLRVGWRSRPRTWQILVGFIALLGLALLSFVVAIPAAGRAAAVIGGVLLPVFAALSAALPPALKALHAGERLLNADKQAVRAYDEAMQRYDEAKAALDRLRSGASATLYDFVVERYQTDEYRKHLGMAPLIRDDLERLATEAKKPGNIQRVVIYIDDLDRCSTEQVVRVLEAVNLLFGFDLFVAIVAVDSRWLVKSLKQEFRAVFDTPGPSTPTPRNYLEKIIQIPFWLRPMSSTGFEQLVATLTTAPDDAPATSPSVTPDTPVPVPAAARAVQPGAGTAPTPPPNESAPTEPGAEPDLIDLNPQTLTITTDEIAFTKRLAPFVHTPRVAKRFVNTYQLLRLAVDDVDGFLERREFEPLLILLAIMTGSIDVDDEMMVDLATGPGLSHALANGRWAVVADALEGLPTDGLTQSFLTQWLPRVARFAFRGVALPRHYGPDVAADTHSRGKVG